MKTSRSRWPNRQGRSLNLATTADRSVSFMPSSMLVTSAIRRDHSRTLPCNMNRSRSRATNTRLASCASSNATMEAAISRPNSD
jgi:hypothetical protein